MYKAGTGLSVLSVMLLMTAGCGSSEQADDAVSFSPERYAALVETLSEPGGFFDSDNIVSNEAGYLHVKHALKRLGVEGGVYIGVGPDQNFTYIAQIRPRYAFILDIRRDNLIEHLLYKAVFALAESRSDYLSVLFSKPLSSDGFEDGGPTIEALVTYLDRTDGDEDLYRRNLESIQSKIRSFGLSLSAEETGRVSELYRAFFEQNLDLKWEYRSDGDRGISFITYRTFLLGRDLEGAHGNFLDSNEDYRFIRDMQARNAIFPVTGNFAGSHALKAIGSFARERGDRVSAFYLSNVEYYLFPDGYLDEFAENVRYLPMDERSVLIRAFVNLRGQAHPVRADGHLMTTVLQYGRSFSQLFADGAYRSYQDLGRQELYAVGSERPFDRFDRFPEHTGDSPHLVFGYAIGRTDRDVIAVDPVHGARSARHDQHAPVEGFPHHPARHAERWVEGVVPLLVRRELDAAEQALSAHRPHHGQIGQRLQPFKHLFPHFRATRDEIMPFDIVLHRQGGGAGQGISAVGMAMDEGWRGCIDGLVYLVSHDRGGDRRISTAQALAGSHQVRDHAPVVDPEVEPGPAVAGDDFINDHENPVVIADFPDRAEVIVRRRQPRGGGAQDGFDDKGGDVFGACLADHALQFVGAVLRYMREIQQVRRVVLPPGRPARHGQCADRVSVPALPT